MDTLAAEPIKRIAVVRLAVVVVTAAPALASVITVDNPAVVDVAAATEPARRIEAVRPADVVVTDATGLAS